VPDNGKFTSGEQVTVGIELIGDDRITRLSEGYIQAAAGTGLPACRAVDYRLDLS
jgi:hypothetical protein